MGRPPVLATLTLCTLGCNVERSPPAIAPRLGNVLALPTIAEAGAMRRREAPSEFGQLSTAQGPKRPRSCVEWENLHAEHAEAVNDVEQAGDQLAGQRCDALQWLTRARPSARSFVAWEPGLAPLLPATIATSWDEAGRAARDAAASKGKTLRDHAPDAVLDATPEQFTWSEPGGTSKVVVRPIAWADLNGDGTEDLLLAVSNLDGAGPMTEQRVLAVTRDGAAGPVRMLMR